MQRLCILFLVYIQFSNKDMYCKKKNISIPEMITFSTQINVNTARIAALHRTAPAELFLSCSFLFVVIHTPQTVIILRPFPPTDP